MVRLLCPTCKVAIELHQNAYPKQFIPPFQVNNQFVPKGCAACYYTGYKGRKAVYEVIPIDADLGLQIKQANMDISEQLKARNIGTLAENAFSLFAAGETALEEIYPLLLTI